MIQFGDHQGQTLSGGSCDSADFPGPLGNVQCHQAKYSSWLFNGLGGTFAKVPFLPDGLLWKMVLENCHHHIDVLSHLVPYGMQIICHRGSAMLHKHETMEEFLFGTLKRDTLIALPSAFLEGGFLAFFICRDFAFVNPEK